MELLTLQYKYYWQEQLDSILYIANKSREIAERWKDQDPFFAACQVMAKAVTAQVYCMQGHYSKGLSNLESSLSELQKLSEIPDYVKFRVSNGFVGLGWIFEEIGDLEKALECHIQAERLQSQLVEQGFIPPYWLVYKSRNLGDIYFKLERFELSEQLYKRAIEQARESMPACEHMLYSAILAGFYIRVGAQDKANILLAQMKESLDTPSCQNEKKRHRYNYLWEVGRAYFELDSFEIAVTILENALAQLSQLPASDKIIRSQEQATLSGMIAESNLALNRPDLAQNYLDRAKASWLEFHTINNDFWYQLMLIDGKIKLFEKDWQAALSQFDNMLTQNIPHFSGIGNASFYEVQDWPISPWILQTLRGRLEAQFNQWQAETAAVDLQNLLRETDLVQKYLEILLLTYTTDYSKSKVFSRNRSVYEIPIQLCLDQYQRTGDPKYQEKLFYYFEKSKALQLLSTVKEKQSQSFYGVSDELLEKLRVVRREKNFFKKKIAEIYNNTAKNQDLKTEYQNKLQDLQVTFDSLQLILQQHHPDYYDINYDLSVVELSDLWETLDLDEVLVSYFWGHDQVYVLAVSQQHISSWTIPLNQDFLFQLETFRQFMATPPDEEGYRGVIQEDFTLGQDLFQSLLFPALKDQQGIREITLIPDGPLAYLPWTALPTATVIQTTSFREFPFLIKQFALQQEYSATLLRTDIPRNRLEIPYVGFAPDYQGNTINGEIKVDELQLRSAFGTNLRFAYGPLQYNLPEVENVGKLYKKGVQLLGKNATESQFKKYVNRGSILHLAMHAATNDKDPNLSHLVFSADSDSLEDGILFAYELYNMNIPSELAILSACNTGAGKILDGQGVMSLARAFKYAGCRDVLMTHWPAYDRSTSKIITGFFEYYRNSNFSKAEALQRSTLDYLQQESNEVLVHPYYWAGFTLIGTGEALPGSSTWPWLSIGLGVFLIGVLVIRTRR